MSASIMYGIYIPRLSESYCVFRLTPVYMIVVMLWFSLSPLLSSISPFWPIEGFDQVCKNYWWSNLLYLNNIPFFLQEGMVSYYRGWSNSWIFRCYQASISK